MVTISSSLTTSFLRITLLATLGVRPVLTLSTGELRLALRAPVLGAGEGWRAGAGRRSAVAEESLVVEERVELLLCRLTELTLPLLLWQSSRAW